MGTATAEGTERETDGPGGRGAPDLSAGRACGVLAASAVAPGSGHLLLGARRTGWFVLGLSLVLGVAAIVLAGVAWRSWQTLLPYLLRPDVLTVLRGGALALAAAWLLVVLSAGWMVLRRTRRRGVQVLAGVLAVALCATIAAPAVAVSRYAGTTGRFIDSVFPSGPGTAQGGSTGEEFSDPVFADGRLNVLLIGGDAGDNREGLRADTVILASTEVASGRTVLISLPRNLEDFPFERGSVMARQFPSGYGGCRGAHQCLLNSVYTWGQQHPHLFPGEKDPGATALSSAVAGILGQPVEFWALVDLRGFRRVIDALGGVTLRVDQRLPIGGVGGPVTGYLEPGLQRLDGYEALWYARSRAENLRGDYDRIDRQRCLIGALARQVQPATLLRRYQEVASATDAALDTSIPRHVLADLVTLGQRVRDSSIRSLTLTPPLVSNTADPDIRRIRRLVRRALAASSDGTGSGSASEAPATVASPSPDSPGPEPSASAEARESPEPTQRAAPRSSAGPNPSEDLSSVCS